MFRFSMVSSPAFSGWFAPGGSTPYFESRAGECPTDHSPPFSPDSYSVMNQVWLLAPSPHGLTPNGTAHLACLVQGVSSPVQISWNISQEQRPMHLLKTSNGSFTLISHISIPAEAWTSGAAVTCEVRFNASERSVKRRVSYVARK